VFVEINWHSVAMVSLHSFLSRMPVGIFELHKGVLIMTVSDESSRDKFVPDGCRSTARIGWLVGILLAPNESPISINPVFSVYFLGSSP